MGIGRQWRVAAGCGGGRGGVGSGSIMMVAAEVLQRWLGTVVAAEAAAWQQQRGSSGTATAAAVTAAR
jgi:hypothetical protein